MADLSTSNLLWYIYQRNRAVGYPTVISMQEFLHEFPSASRKDIEQELDNLINGMNFVHRRFLCVYDLTEEGLKEIQHLQKFVPSPRPKIWWVSLLQMVACWVSKPIKAITVVLLMPLLCCTVLWGSTNDVSVPAPQLPVLIDGSCLLSNFTQHVSMQERRICELAANAELTVANVEGTLSNKITCLSNRYESKLKRRLGEIDVEIGDAIRDREFYARRYAELKSTHEHFMAYLSIISGIVCIFLPLILTWVQRKDFEREADQVRQNIKSEVDTLGNKIEGYASDIANTKVALEKIKIEVEQLQSMSEKMAEANLDKVVFDIASTTPNVLKMIDEGAQVGMISKGVTLLFVWYLDALQLASSCGSEERIKSVVFNTLIDGMDCLKRAMKDEMWNTIMKDVSKRIKDSVRQFSFNKDAIRCAIGNDKGYSRLIGMLQLMGVKF